MSGDLMLRGGHVVDPTLGFEGRCDILVREGRIAAIGRLRASPGVRIIDVEGLTVAPGLVDVHVHLREPGQEWKETLASGTMAAAAGGFTTVFCMPNTEPALDSVVALELLRSRMERDVLVKLLPIAAISEGRQGRRAVDYRALAKAGAVGFSDDGDSTADSGIMREALNASKRLHVPVMVHCEEPTLRGGALHEGDISRKLGIPGLPAVAEEGMIERDLALAKLTGGWLHVCHVSTARGGEMIAQARRAGIHVTSEVMPHHLVMTDEWVAGSRDMVDTDSPSRPSGQRADPDTKVNPPLRTANDAKTLLGMLRRGEIDLVATDHAPHARPEKQGRRFAAAAFGMSGSEYALPTLLALVRAGKLTRSQMVAAMSSVPARLWCLPVGTLAPGTAADIVVFDERERWRVNPDSASSRSANSPLVGAELQGRVKMTYINGVERYRD